MIISHNIPICEEYGNMIGAIRKYNMKRLKAMTFIEVLIAIVITGMILSSILTGLIFANKYAKHNANKTMALNFAQESMERIKNYSFSQIEIPDPDDVLLYQNEDLNITADRAVTVTLSSDGSYKTITSNVSWDWMGDTHEEELATRVYNY